MRVSVWATKKPPSHPRLTRELTTPASSDPSAQAPEKDGAKPKAKKDKGEKKPSAPAADFDAFEEAKTVIIVPANQLELTQKEMDEEITKQLTANNPNAPANIARYNTKEREYKFEPMIDQLVMHFASDGYLLHRDSDAAKQQLQLEAFMEGYARFADLDPRELALIEPLRTMRMIRYAAWLADRWEDPAFPRAFPWFGEDRYWQDHLLSLREQLAAMQGPPLTL